MEDKNQNMIPDKYDRLILRVGTGVAAVIGAYGFALKASGGTIPLWVAVAVAAIPAALTIFSFTGGAK